MKKFVIVLLMLASVVLFALSGYAQLGESEVPAKPAQKAPIKIGAVLSISGPASWLGEPERKTLVMYVEEINNAGGVKGHPIELIVEDDEGVETKAVNAVNKLITNDKVIAIIGSSRSGTSLAMIPVVERYKIPMISLAAAAAITEPVKPYVFKTPQKDSDAALRILEHMKKKGYKKIAVIAEAAAFGDQGRKQLKELAPQFGIEIVADEGYDAKAADMTAQLTKIKQSGAEALVNWSIVPAQSIVPKNMKQLEMKIPLYQSHGFGNVRYLEAAGPAAEGIIFPAGRLLAADSLPDDHPQKKVLMDYKKKYEERFKEPVSTFGGHAYDALFMIVEAIKRIEGEITPDKLRNEIEKTKGFVGTGGIFNMSEQDHTGLQKDAFELLTVKDGKFVVLKED